MLLDEDVTTYINIPGTSFKLLEEDLTTCQERRASFFAKDFTTYQERVASHVKKMLQRIRNIWQVTWRKVYNVWGRSCKLLTSRKMLQVSGTSCMLLDEDVTTYKEHHSSYLKKIWQRARNVLQVTCSKFHNVSGTCWRSLEEDVTTYQEHLASYLKKSLQRIRNVSQVTYK